MKYEEVQSLLICPRTVLEPTRASSDLRPTRPRPQPGSLAGDFYVLTLRRAVIVHSDVAVAPPLLIG